MPAWSGDAVSSFAAGAIVAGAAAMMAIGYAHRPDLEKRPDATTPIAALATLALGFIAGLGNPSVAIAGAAVVTLILALKNELHGFLDKLDEDDVKALARYSVIALAVLPFLPSGALRAARRVEPAEIVAGGRAGHRLLVPRLCRQPNLRRAPWDDRHRADRRRLQLDRGHPIARPAPRQRAEGRRGNRRDRARDGGHVPARSAADRRSSRPACFLPFAIIILPAVIVAWGAGFWLYRRAPKSDAPTPPGNPIALLPAFGFVLFVAFAAVAAKWAAGRFGEQGIAVLLLIVGSTDVDTAIITLGGLQPAAISPLLAAIAIAGHDHRQHGGEDGDHAWSTRGRKGLPAVIAMAASVLALIVMIGLAALRL